MSACSICYESTTETPYRCMHECHNVCAEQWIRSSKKYACPLCQALYVREVLVEASRLEKFKYVVKHKPVGTKKLVKRYLDQLMALKDTQDLINSSQYKTDRLNRKKLNALRASMDTIITELSFYKLVGVFKHTVEGVCVEYDTSVKWQLEKQEIGEWGNHRVLIRYRHWIRDPVVSKMIKRLMKHRETVRSLKLSPEFKELIKHASKLTAKVYRLQSSICMAPVVVLVPKTS